MPRSLACTISNKQTPLNAAHLGAWATARAGPTVNSQGRRHRQQSPTGPGGHGLWAPSSASCGLGPLDAGPGPGSGHKVFICSHCTCSKAGTRAGPAEPRQVHGRSAAMPARGVPERPGARPDHAGSAGHPHGPQEERGQALPRGQSLSLLAKLGPQGAPGPAEGEAWAIPLTLEAQEGT